MEEFRVYFGGYWKFGKDLVEGDEKVLLWLNVERRDKRLSYIIFKVEMFVKFLSGEVKYLVCIWV